VLGMRGKARGVACEIRTPGSCRLVEVVVADVRGDGGVHAADDAVEDAFLEAGVVEIEVVGWTTGLDDVAEVVGGFENAKGGGDDGKRGRGGGFGEAVFTVDGIPDVGTCVAGEAFGVVDQADVVAFCSCRFVFGDTVVALVAFVIVFDHAAFAYVFA